MIFSFISIVYLIYLFYRQLIVANESRVIALDEIDEDVIYRVGVQGLSLMILSFSFENLSIYK